MPGWRAGRLVRHKLRITQHEAAAQMAGLDSLDSGIHVREFIPCVDRHRRSRWASVAAFPGNASSVPREPARARRVRRIDLWREKETHAEQQGDHGNPLNQTDHNAVEAGK